MTTTRELLQCTLDRLTQEGTIPSAAELCKQAGISRSALYRYYPDIVSELRELNSIRRSGSNNSKIKLALLTAENKELNSKIEKLASLVDHYFNAWKESENIRRRHEKQLSHLNKIKII